ncbi:ThiF family adenylyltransferase [Actinosynnema sp. NPDC047251]|uniref:Dinucleotide-utilizing enzyme n=1 Tax=Saccharothrix espanaensis (strain ATCC 51144 / DSM 44229 / JCM 9112 / NBRC 15066 / NRRL 15764) TaxID=1179773 RepID=K0JU89_SACES|nr:ThiF family adenylyltransferase [Saccharothrix espanaensis]CCH29491.1 Dinucleotide-utilizing enzyme [Saccharothrix espanaensis DSM 44229]
MHRPRIKYEHLPVRHGEDLVQIGGSLPGVAAMIPDPDGSVWTLLTLLDGTRMVDQVVADLVHRHPDKAPHTVYTAVDALAAAGYLEDADEPSPEVLSEVQRERFARGRALWRWMDTAPRTTGWHAQLALRQARVTVVGVGGVGSTAALALVQSGVGRVHLVEPDVVELSNLNRQILYTENDLGRAKVDVAVDVLRRHNGEVEVTGEQTTVDGVWTLRRLATGCDVLLMAADTPHEIRSWTNRACLDTGTTWVHGGYHGPRAGVGLFVPGNGPCYDCARTAAAREQLAAPPSTPWPEMSGTTGTHAANAVSAGIAGHLAGHAVMSLITGIPRLRANRQIGYNLITLQHSTFYESSEPEPDCPACARSDA